MASSARAAHAVGSSGAPVRFGARVISGADRGVGSDDGSTSAAGGAGTAVTRALQSLLDAYEKKKPLTGPLSPFAVSRCFLSLT